jgi:electron-transferring-flavoprotein dehydrogenase
MSKEILFFDVLIIGAGPAGLSAAIKLKQLQPTLSVCILEKGSQVGAHILSGCIFNPTALNELIPDWKNLNPPIKTAAKTDHFLALTQKNHYRLPTPKSMKNTGNYIISLGKLCQWLAEYAINLGVEIFAGFAGQSLLINDENQTYGIVTNDVGLDKAKKPTDRFQAGIEIHAKQVLLAEGCRGSLSKQAIKHYQLDKGRAQQTYALGIKEIWEVPSEYHDEGRVEHSIGWPLDHKTYGGSFCYHAADNKIFVGFVVGLDYENPYLSPFHIMQQFKTHPYYAPMFAKGKRLSYGARTLVEGGLQALPKLSFNGGMLIGDSAGFLNVPQLKGSHMAMKSGIIAAESLIQNFGTQKEIDYLPEVKKTWLWTELYEARNIRPAFQYGLISGLIYSAIDTYIFKGRAPWTFQNKHADHEKLHPKDLYQPIDYPKPDHVITFDIPSSVYLSNTFHEENQPCHLQLKNVNIPIEVNLKQYDAPEQRYCPAGVYEILSDQTNEARLQINAQNCVHCKTCDIKDPLQNIDWVPPEGGGGPNYSDM